LILTACSGQDFSGRPRVELGAVGGVFRTEQKGGSGMSETFKVYLRCYAFASSASELAKDMTDGDHWMEDTNLIALALGAAHAVVLKRAPMTAPEFSAELKRMAGKE
jgi:hypothetical protein